MDKMKKSNTSWLSALFVILLLSISFVSAAPPFVQQESDTAYTIVTGVPSILPQGQENVLQFHIFNSSDGNIVSTGLSCYIDLMYDGIGHVYNGFNGSSSTNDYSFNIPSTIFNNTGNYGYVAHCNSTVGGFLSSTFVVTPDGTELTTPTSILIIFVLALIFLGLIFSIMGINKADKGEWQIFYVCMSYILLFSLFFLLWFVSDNYLYNIPVLETVFWITWLILSIMFFPFIIFVSLYILKKEGDKLLADDLEKQGYSKDEALEIAKSRKR